MARKRPSRPVPTTWYGKTWHFLWHDDSIWSWLANVVIAFVLIKYVLYPLAGLLLGTSLPVVAVVSGSMQHHGNVLCGQAVPSGTDWWEACGDWYEERGITQEEFRTFPFRNGFWKGDVMIIRGSTPENTAVGDVIVFASGRQYPIIHRVVDLTEDPRRYTTKGDNNDRSISEYGLYDGRIWHFCYAEVPLGIVPTPCTLGSLRVTADTPGARPLLNEVDIPQEHVIGKAIGRIPLIGWVKILAVDLVGLVAP